jgi:hypothetical protein
LTYRAIFDPSHAWNFTTPPPYWQTDSLTPNTAAFYAYRKVSSRAATAVQNRAKPVKKQAFVTAARPAAHCGALPN